MYQISSQSIVQLLRNFTQNQKCQSHGGTRRKARASSSQMQIHPLGTMNVCGKFTANHQVDVEIFHWIIEKFDPNGDAW